MISIILPCYNPVDGWCRDLLVNMTMLNEKLAGYTTQYIISNDGSTKLEKHDIETLKFIPNVIFLDHPVNEGKGAAIRKGAKHAEGNIVIYTDIDFPFGTDPVVEIVKMLEENPQCRFVYGNRSSEYFKKLPLKRQLFSKVLLLLNHLFLSNQITDTQAGIKGFRREVLPDIQETKTNTFVFEIELIRKLVRKGIGIKKVEVCAQPSIVFSDFSMKVLFREGINFVRIILMKSV